MPYVIFLGEDEIEQDMVSLKNMRTGEQELISAADAVTKIAATLDAAGDAPIRDKV